MCMGGITLCSGGSIEHPDLNFFLKFIYNFFKKKIIY